MEGVTLTTSLTIGIFRLIGIRILSRIFTNWIRKKIPFDKDRLIIDLKINRLYNRSDKKELSMYLNFLNLNYVDIWIKKIKFEVRSNTFVIDNFERTITAFEQKNQLVLIENLSDARMENYSKNFFQIPNRKEFYMTEREISFHISVIYEYFNLENLVEYKFDRFLEMDKNSSN